MFDQRVCGSHLNNTVFSAQSVMRGNISQDDARNHFYQKQ